MAAHPPTPSHEAALSLALAVVRSSPGPLLLLDGDLSVIGASNSFCEAFDLDLAGVRGVGVLRVGAGEWASKGLSELLESSLAGAPKVRVCETLLRRLGRGDRHLVIHAERLFPGPNWALIVSDNGVGVPTDRRDTRVGLGTSIVEALAGELGATVEVAPAHPGTRVTVARTAIALVDETEPRGASAMTTPAASRPAA